MRGFKSRQQPVAGESSDPGGLKRQGKIKRHCVRWWWIYVIAIFVALAAIVVFPILYVAFPNTAQDAINRSDLVITNQSILSPTSDSFYLEQTAICVTGSTQSARLDAWKGSLCLDPNCPYPFAELDIPESQAKNGTQMKISQAVQITNIIEFNTYTRLALGSEMYSFYLVGKGKLHKGAWPAATVQYDKNISMKGLNALKGFNVTTFNLITPALPDGTNANGSVSIPNPSVSRYELGDLTLTMSVDDVSIGTCFLNDVFLGVNDVPIPMTAITNATAIAGLVSARYKTGVLPVDIVASSVLYQGQHIPWYEQAIGALPLRVDLNILLALQQ